jgi:2-polyprenyl-3-methyl-5-hydroxy-6-metoxy-1,4-benzoquinol methylase
METSGSRAIESENGTQEPWQLQMFKRSLKKQQKLQALLSVLGEGEGQDCLLVTCGDNNGALNWHFKNHGGNWSWADAEKDSTQQISELTGDPVASMDKEKPALSFPDNHFDVVMTIDVHEHLRNPHAFNQELARIAKPAGRVIVTTPNGDGSKLANRIKKLIGMRPEDYGHFVIGYDVPDLQKQLQEVGLEPYTHTSYARFFTEMLELVINFAYVKVLSKRSEAKVEKGQIAPQNKDQIESVGKTYKLYSLVYPFFLLFSKLDALVSFRRGYAVVVAARKES